MKKGIKWLALILAALLAFTLAACNKKKVEPDTVLDYGDPDLSGEVSAGLESAASYRTRFKNGSINIGDVMPYYHDGIYSFFYLAETTNHPVYRVDTTDFIHYEDKGEALSPGGATARDSMIGTGSIVEAKGDYYFFYTGFVKDTPEAVMVAKSTGNIDNFVKVSGFEMSGTGNGSDLDGYDFRDPEARFDEENDRFELYISARRNDEAVIAKYYVPFDLSSYTYEGVIYSDNRDKFNVLECSDLFELNGKWYLTYSVQDLSNGGNDGAVAMQAETGTQGRVFYAMSDSKDGPFTRISDAALDSHAFYAAKTIQDGSDTYLAGWVRKKGSNLGWNYSWGGNLEVHKLTASADGTLNVSLPDSVRNYYSVERELDEALQGYNGFDLIEESSAYHTVSPEYSSYLLHTYVKFDEDVKEAGFALGVTSNTASILKVAFVPHANKLRSGMNGNREITSKYMRIVPGQEYDVTLLVEGSCVTMYVDGSIAFTSRLANLGNKKLAVYAISGTATFRDFHLYTPSDYADTLGSGYGELVVTENGTARKGRVSEVHVTPSSPATIAYTASNDNYLMYTASLYSAQAADVAVRKGDEQIGSLALEAGKLGQISGSVLASKGEQLTMEITSPTDTSVLVNASVETDKKKFAREVKFSGEGSGTQTYTAGERGTYEYIASAYYGGGSEGDPVLSVGGATAKLSDKARLVTVHGSVALAAGESLDASIAFGSFTASPGDARVSLTVFGGKGDTFARGVGSVVDYVRTSDVISTETVVTFEGITVDGGRENSVEMNGNTFGEQGKSGFIYAYGRSGDELLPMSEYNTNGEAFEYKHTAPEANGALEIKADFMKQGGGYVTAVVWIAAEDGAIDVAATYSALGAAYAHIQIYRNRSLLMDRVTTPEEKQIGMQVVGVEVKAGDAIVFAVGTAGTAVAEGDGNYSFVIGAGNTSIPYNENAPLIANHADDFTADRQGDYGWYYMNVGYTFDGNEHPTTAEELEKTSYGWGTQGKGVDADGVIHGEASVVWKNETAGALGVSVCGSITGSNNGGNAWVRMWVIRTDDRREKLDATGFTGTHELPKKGMVLNPGDMIAVMAFDNNGDGLTLDMQIKSTDAVTIELTALDGEIAKAENIRDTQEAMYTPQSFAALTAAINAAAAFRTDAESGDKTYTEISAAVGALKQAIAGLELTSEAVDEAYNAAIARAEKIEHKDLLGDEETFTAALAAAHAAASGTAAEKFAAAAALEAAMENVAAVVADFQEDFTEAQGVNGWYYYSAVQVFNPYRVESVTNLDFSSGKLSKDLWKDNGTAVAYRNYTAQTHTYKFVGKVEYTSDSGFSACVSFAIKKADGTFKSYGGDWNQYSAAQPLSLNMTVELLAGEELIFVMRDVDQKATDSKLTLKVGCNDDLAADTSALRTLVDETRAEYGDKGSDYTEDTYRALTEALSAADTVLASPAPSASDVSGAIKGINDAIAGLVPNTEKAKEELQEAITEANALKDKDLMGDVDGFNSALTAAQEEAGREEATAAELFAARNNLLDAMGKVTVKVAELSEESFPESQGRDGWHFGRSEQVYDPSYHLTSFTEIPYAEGKFVEGNVEISPNLWKESGATIAYFNYTGDSHTYKFVGTVEYLGSGSGATVAFVIRKADGTFETKEDWKAFSADEPLTIDRTETLGAGDAFLMVMRNQGPAATDSKITIKVGCDDELAVDTSALNALIEATEAAYKSEDYTEESFGVLTEALNTARGVVSSGSATAEQVASATKGINDAIDALVPGVEKAKADLTAEIEKATALAAKDLIGDKDALNSAIQTATAARDRDGATAQDLKAALEALKEEEAKVTVKVAELSDTEFPERQGEDGWHFGRSEQAYDGGYHLTGFTEIPYAEGKFAAGNVEIGSTLWKESGATIAYFNYTAESHTYKFVGKVDYIGGGELAVVAFVIRRADGTFETKRDWNELKEGNPLTIDRTETLGAGDAFLMVLRKKDEEATDSKITLEVGCNDDLVTDITALNAAIARAEAIQPEGYTEASYRKLTEAKQAASEIVTKGETERTPGDVYSATKAIDDAILGLEGTSLAELLTEGSGWSVYKVAIDWPTFNNTHTMTVTAENKIPYLSETHVFEGSGVTVQNGTDGYVKANSDNAIIFMFTAPEQGSYKITLSIQGGTRGDCRCFEETGDENQYKEAAERSFIGQNTSDERTVTLEAGHSIYFQFEGTITDLIIRLTAEKQ